MSAIFLSCGNSMLLLIRFKSFIIQILLHVKWEKDKVSKKMCFIAHKYIFLTLRKELLSFCGTVNHFVGARKIYISKVDQS